MRHSYKQGWDNTWLILNNTFSSIVRVLLGYCWVLTKVFSQGIDCIDWLVLLVLFNPPSLVGLGMPKSVRITWSIIQRLYMPRAIAILHSRRNAFTAKYPTLFSTTIIQANAWKAKYTTLASTRKIQPNRLGGKEGDSVQHGGWEC